MPERPPPGYNRRDKPLPHEFYYQVALVGAVNTGNNFQATFLRTSTSSVDPKTIPVNPRHAAYAVDDGPVVCFDSIVQFITISTDISLTEGFMHTDKLAALKYYWWNIHGAFEDSWTPADERTTTTIAQLLHVTSTVAQEDVVPETGGLNITGVDHPFSTVTMPEVFGDYDLSTNATPEDTTTDNFILRELFDAKQYYTNGGKLNSLMGSINTGILTSQRNPHHSMFEKKFTPKQCRFANPHMIFSRQYHVPIPLDPSSAIGAGDSTASVNSLNLTIRVRFNEWNPDFDQARM